MGFGSGSFISRVYTNSFATKNIEAYSPFNRNQRGNSFYGLSKPQYSHQTYYQLAYNGAGMGNRGDRWLRANGVPNISFIPPK
jgi:hypothetical protein